MEARIHPWCGQTLARHSSWVQVLEGEGILEKVLEGFLEGVLDKVLEGFLEGS